MITDASSAPISQNKITKEQIIGVLREAGEGRTYATKHGMALIRANSL